MIFYAAGAERPVCVRKCAKKVGKRGAGKEKVAERPVAVEAGKEEAGKRGAGEEKEKGE